MLKRYYTGIVINPYEYNGYITLFVNFMQVSLQNVKFKLRHQNSRAQERNKHFPETICFTKNKYYAL